MPKILDAEVLTQYHQSVQGEALTTLLWADHLINMNADFDDLNKEGKEKDECDEYEDGDGDGDGKRDAAVGSEDEGPSSVRDVIDLEGEVLIMDLIVGYDNRSYAPIHRGLWFWILRWHLR